jgi:hypothetical protein
MTWFGDYLVTYIYSFLYEISLLQYSAVDTSPLSIYVMHPFWNYVVEVSSLWFRF